MVDAIVRTIPQYRLYATSLLFLYDGATEDEIEALDEESGIKYSPDLRVKIVDFAHAITDLHASDVTNAPFPPTHPSNPDRGYLKGLASLKYYFERYLFASYLRRIWREHHGNEDMFEGVGDKSFRTHSSTAGQTPFKRENITDEDLQAARIKSALNEVAVEEKYELDEDGWSDVSV
jgi:inositol-hexakisphosphate 5-kinase